MEYIEPKPVEKKPHAKRNKIILWSSIAAVVVAAVSLTYYFLITQVFIEKENIDLLTYSYRYDIDGDGIRIDAVREDVTLPAHFRIPSKIDGRPVVEIADDVFSTNTDIVEMIFPDSLKIIGNNCFSDCTNLEKFNVPASLETVGTDAFSNTKWLNDHEDGEVSVGKMLYTYKGEMEYPSCIVASEDSPEYEKPEYETVINLGKYNHITSGVFKDQTGLKYAEIPEQLTTINESLFEGCSKLEKVVLHEKVTTIEECAFSGCESLTDFLLPTSVTYIGNLAFQNTAIPGPIYFPENLEYLGYGTFKGDIALTDVHFPYGFSTIPDSSFYGCKNLTGVYFDDKEFTSESRISYIGENAFRYTGLETFATPYNVHSIMRNAFSECPNFKTLYVYNNTTATYQNVLEYDYDKDEYRWAKSKTDFQGLIQFESGVFSDSPNFKSIVLVDVDNVPETSSNEVHIPLTCTSLGSANEDTVLFYNTCIEILDLRRDLSSVTNEKYLTYLNENQLTTIQATLCKNAKKLHTVYFPESIATLNSGAFSGCISLTEIALSDNILVVGANIFEDCENLKDVTLSKYGTTIGTGMFSNCASIETMNIPATYKTIGISAFSNCTALKSINFESDKTITNIGQNAFSGCSALESIAIPDTCNSLATGIFRNCTSLSNVTLPTNDVLTVLKAEMFTGCTSLVNLTLPETFKSIEKNVFADSGLKNLTLKCESQVVSLETSAFTGCSLENIYVPADLLEQYLADDNWKALSSIIHPIA